MKASKIVSRIGLDLFLVLAVSVSFPIEQHQYTLNAMQAVRIRRIRVSDETLMECELKIAVLYQEELAREFAMKGKGLD